MIDETNDQSAVAVVTGAGTGIGRAIAHRLARCHRVVLAGRRREPLEETRQSIAAVTRAPADSIEVRPTDVTSPTAVDALFYATCEHWGRVDVLVNNAGVAGPIAPIWEQSLEGWEETLRSNVTGVFLCSRAATRTMRAQRAGRIITIGSVTGKRPLDGRTPYATSKTALIGLTRTLAVELGPYGVTVNLLSPGAVATDRLAALAQAAGITTEALSSRLRDLTALDRISTPEDVAAAVAYLASAEARNITGVDLNVDAGLWFS